ncbi:PD-(D/E)XK nuclease family protein [Devosia algicola]|uniref:PD-(D/E)XK nuclease family protein n=1 Tax=Devosia algicola TaxID=3026418 RepID=A0ABY7YLG4_9HYPH|nr:PD-(D/E)XK nuclease family protein [Devosia algicola]WDR02103.1 PD-(D/E)XK nuclease family protein [Devosia algicola]
MLETLERLDPEIARQQGIALHALLQHLGRVPRTDWDIVLDRAMPVLLPDAPDLADSVRQKAVAILTRPELAGIFGANSRAEVPFLMTATRRDKPVKLAGRIDRIVVTDDSVTVIDYKSDANVPAVPTEVPPHYLMQLGLYALVARQLFPGKTVNAQILWTAMESLMNLPQDLLQHSVSDFTMG